MVANLKSDKSGNFFRLLHQTITENTPKHLLGCVEKMLDQYFQRVNYDELIKFSPIYLAKTFVNHLMLAEKRNEKDLCVSVFNPVIDPSGWESPNTVIQIVCPDSPFLVDSVGVAISEWNLTTQMTLHPVFKISRNKVGIMSDIGKDKASLESWMHFEVGKITDERALDKLHLQIIQALQDVYIAVSDWQIMQKKIQQLIINIRKNAIGLNQSVEVADFLEWILDNNFTILGYEELEANEIDNINSLKQSTESCFGVLKNYDPVGGDKNNVYPLLAGNYQRNREKDFSITLTKTRSRSTVHRSGYMDYIGVPCFEAGKLIGEARIVGLYTSVAYNRRPENTPLIRDKVKQVIERSELYANSHGLKALQHIIETLPRDELFQCNEDELYDLATGILYLQERQQTRFFMRKDIVGGFFSCLVFIHRDRFDTETRKRVEKLLQKRLKGERVDFTLSISESMQARLYLIVRPRNELIDIDQKEVEKEVVKTVRSWKDELHDTLMERFGDIRGLELSKRYGEVFPAAYQEDITPWVASFDVPRLAELISENDMTMSLYRPRRRKQGILRFKIFKYDSTIPLSNALPMLENMGLHILSERPYELALNNKQKIWIQDFDMSYDDNKDFDIDQIKDNFQQAFEKIWREEAENDAFNRLILKSRLHWRQVALIRAYCKYLLQTELPYSQSYMEATLCAYFHITRVIIELFYARLDPDRDRESNKQKQSRSSGLKQALSPALTHQKNSVLKELTDELVLARRENRHEQISACVNYLQYVMNTVASGDEDRILRSFINTTLATLRTNYFKYDKRRKTLPYISLKLDSTKVPDLPAPRPKYEIFVYSPRVEGIHLRGGDIARGGLRWSDRKEDFRTEVHGLMKAQMVKNALIVPVGAKGGFVVKKSPENMDRAQLMNEVTACYKQFISGLLDITDNYSKKGVVYPSRVMKLDEDDPYLVVAADKGTATFSDTANEIAKDYQFWLDDAFASGGSQGYDHKKMGITAKGAWESVKQHFREIGKNCQEQEFTVVGIGDMSGDVFGNGMLLSKYIQLKAAFNHLHIFIDPTPNVTKSYKERERLFNLPRSTWADYDSKLISKGGGIYLRNSKEIKLSNEVREWLGIPHEVITPDNLIQELLKAPIDLLWNGGIGTYVKASYEFNQNVGDHTNDRLRVNALDLRCKIVGEGGNLGFTQLGRIEFALHGGLVNTDSIDNSAGVDCSDHEVNIKILLNNAMATGKLDMEKRNKLLENMTNEVASLVIRNNYLQVQAISLMAKLSVDRLGAKMHFINELEAARIIDREIEYLPTDEEATERKAKGLALTRPELSVLLSYSKMILFQDLISSDVPEDPYLSQELVRYFPLPLQKKYADLMEQHRLRREIITTMVTNSIVNRMGVTFVLRMREDTGRSSAAVARAYTIAREIFNVRLLWEQIEKLDNIVSTNIQLDMYLVIWHLLRQATRWLLNCDTCQLNITQAVKRLEEGILLISDNIEKIVIAGELDKLNQHKKILIKAKVPKSLANYIASAPAIYAALDICEVAGECDYSVLDVGKIYFQLGEAFKLDWLSDQIEKLLVEGQWHAHARGTLRDDLYKQRRQLTSKVLQSSGNITKNFVAEWVKKHQSEIEPALVPILEMYGLKNMDYATILVALRNMKLAINRIMV